MDRGTKHLQDTCIVEVLKEELMAHGSVPKATERWGDGGSMIVNWRKCQCQRMVRGSIDRETVRQGRSEPAPSNQHDLIISQVSLSYVTRIVASCISQSPLLIELAKGFIFNYTFQNCIELIESYVLFLIQW